MSKNILVIGTGTIGEPLIGLLADFKKKLDIDNVFFHKRTPLTDEIAKVNSLINRGAKLVVDPEKAEAFQKLEHEPTLYYKAALELCDVIIDCTPAGNIAKKEHYLPLLGTKENKKKVFIAQGSEKGFGTPYAYGINDAALLKSNSQFIQIVSCNTHNIASLVNTLTPNIIDLVRGDFVCIRRANDISQNGSFIASPEVGIHKDKVFGTHHARDAYDLFRTLHKCPNIFSSALKTNTQYMHTIRFNIQIKPYTVLSDVINLFKENKFIALTKKTLANKVFSFGRDHGYYGRIFNQTVIVEPTLTVDRLYGTSQIAGFCFTPQDGNSLLSSIAAALYGLHGETYKTYMKLFNNMLFQEI